MIASVTRRASFEALRSDGFRVRSGPVSLVFATTEPQPSLAFAFGKRFGTAVERNRARRRLRAAFGVVSQQQSLQPGAYLIGGSRRVLTADFSTLVDALDDCCSLTVTQVEKPKSPVRQGFPVRQEFSQ